MEGSILILVLVIVGFVLSLVISRVNRKHDRIVNWISLIGLVAGTIWLTTLMAIGTETGIFIVLLAMMFAGQAVKIGWELWSDREHHNQLQQ